MAAADLPLPGRDYSRRQRYLQLISQLERERQSWEPKWRDQSDYILQDRSRFLITDTNRGDTGANRIIDSTGTESADTLAAGLATGMTSPASPWFELDIPDRDLAQFGAAKRWLDDTAQDMRDLMVSTNLYLALHTMYGDLGVFGVSPMAVEEDVEKVARCTVHPIGSYYLACNEKNLVDTFARKFRMTVRQVVRKFGIDQVTRQTRILWEQNRLNDQVDVVHLILPNEARDPSSPLARNMAFRSCYFEHNSDEDIFLSESGFEEFPIMAPRWAAKAEDVYGTGPGRRALPDVKALQVMHKQLAASIEKMNNPPMVGAPELRNKKLSLLPGAVTIADERDGRKAFRPAIEVQPQIEPMLQAIADHRARIRRAFHADLFLMQTLDARAQPPTAEEIKAREMEKLLQLGPVYNRLSDELFDPLISRFFGIMVRRRLVRPAPPELHGMPLKVKYTNVLAQAQRQVGIGAIERYIGFVVGNAQAFPEMLDTVDADAASDSVAEKLGVPAKIVRTPEAVAARRAQRAQQQKAQEGAALAQQMADTGKTLSETDTTGDNMLTNLGNVIGGRTPVEAPGPATPAGT